jgi:hypothetical protein
MLAEGRVLTERNRAMQITYPDVGVNMKGEATRLLNYREPNGRLTLSERGQNQNKHRIWEKVK